MSSSSAILLILAVLGWFLLLGTLASFSDHSTGDRAMGIGLAQFFGSAMLVGVWLLLGGLLLIAGSSDVMPGWAQGAAAVLHPAWGLAAGAALYLLTKTDSHWPMVVPILAPLLLVLYLVCLYQPSLRSAFAPQTASVVVWTVVGLLAVAPWPAVMAGPRPESPEQTEARLIRGAAERAASERAQYMASLQQLPADAPLRDYFQYLREDSLVRVEAVEAVRKVERRQADAEDLLEAGVVETMGVLPDAELQATPRLCVAAVAILRERVHDARLNGLFREQQAYALYEKDKQILAGARWLAAQHCQCGAEIREFEKAAQTYRDSADRVKLLAVLAEIRVVSDQEAP